MNTLSKQEKDINYIKMEKPVVIVDLEKPIADVSPLYKAIIDASFAMTEVGIYNLALKVDQETEIDGLLQMYNTYSN